MTNLRKAKKYLNRYTKIGKRYKKDADSDKLLNCVEKCFFFECPHETYLKKQRERVEKLFNRLIGHDKWYYMDVIDNIVNKRKEERRNKRIYSYGNKSLPKSK